MDLKRDLVLRFFFFLYGDISDLFLPLPEHWVVSSRQTVKIAWCLEEAWELVCIFKLSMEIFSLSSSS
jgi:hypothetical protein